MFKAIEEAKKKKINGEKTNGKDFPTPTQPPSNNPNMPIKDLNSSFQSLQNNSFLHKLFGEGK